MIFYRTAQSLLSAAVHVAEKYLRHETLVAVSFLMQNWQIAFVSLTLNLGLKFLITISVYLYCFL